MVVNFYVESGYLTGGTDKNRETPSHDSRSQGRFFNLGPRIQGRSANYTTVTPYYQTCRERYRDKLHTEISRNLSMALFSAL